MTTKTDIPVIESELELTIGPDVPKATPLMVQDWEHLRKLSAFIDQYGRGPTTPEMTAVCDLPFRSSAGRVSLNFEAWGWIDKPNGPESVRLTGKGRRQLIEYIRWQGQQAGGWTFG